MIHSLKVKNFLSFKDEVEFSFEATNDKDLSASHVVEISPKVRLLKLGIVYGANASGKSNLVKAFNFFHYFWFRATENKFENINITPFLLDNKSESRPTEFELIFYVNRIKYIYSLIINKQEVILEKLTYYPKNQPSIIFSRITENNFTEISYNSNFKISPVEKEQIGIKCLKNMSFFAAYNSLNIQLSEIDIVINWFKNNYLPTVKPEIKFDDYTESLINLNESIKRYVLKFLNEADFNIVNVNIENKSRILKIDDNFVQRALLNPNIPIEEKERIQKEKTITAFEKQSIFKHKVTDSDKNELLFDLPKNLQSDGTLRTMGLACVINKLIERNGFLAIDEIESSLHPKLVEFIIETFLKESKESQLLLTTHYDGLLEERDLFRNDNIWFTSKKPDGSTELYSLSDFNGVNRITLLKKAYKYGKFGAIPNI